MFQLGRAFFHLNYLFKWEKELFHTYPHLTLSPLPFMAENVYPPKSIKLKWLECKMVKYNCYMVRKDYRLYLGYFNVMNKNITYYLLQFRLGRWTYQKVPLQNDGFIQNVLLASPPYHSCHSTYDAFKFILTCYRILWHELVRQKHCHNASTWLFLL